MKKIIALILFLNLKAISKEYHFFISSTIGKQPILINGKQYIVDSIGVEIKTYYPKFDTLIFDKESANSEMKLICNFKPDSSYVITYACCGSLDIIPKSKFNCDSLKYWDFDKDFDKIQNQFLDKPYLSIRTKNTPRDSVYAWHSDAACLTEHKLIGTELWRLGVPPKCFYWTNITPILFFKTDAKSKKKRNKDVEEFLDKNNVIELTTIYLRLFDNQRFVLTFDEKHNAVKLSYE